MSATRRSSRITKKSCINVKLNASEGIEFVGVNGAVDNVDEWTAENNGEGDEGDEELIVNPDGTMSIKMANNGPKKDADRLECDKCGLSFPTEEVLPNTVCHFWHSTGSAESFFRLRYFRR